MKVGDWSFVIADVCPQKHSANHSLKRKNLANGPAAVCLRAVKNAVENQKTSNGLLVC
jgi:hypothetical protein